MTTSSKQWLITLFLSVATHSAFFYLLPSLYTQEQSTPPQQRHSLALISLEEEAFAAEEPAVPLLEEQEEIPTVSLEDLEQAITSPTASLAAPEIANMPEAIPVSPEEFVLQEENIPAQQLPQLAQPVPLLPTLSAVPDMQAGAVPPQETLIPALPDSSDMIVAEVEIASIEFQIQDISQFEYDLEAPLLDETAISEIQPSQITAQNWRPRFPTSIAQNTQNHLAALKIINAQYGRAMQTKLNQQAIQIKKIAEREKAEGTILVEMVLNRDGSLDSIKLTQRSKSKALNEAVKNAIGNAAPFAPFPENVPYLKLRFRPFPIRIRLKK